MAALFPRVERGDVGAFHSGAVDQVIGFGGISDAVIVFGDNLIAVARQIIQELDVLKGGGCDALGDGPVVIQPHYIILQRTLVEIAAMGSR